MAEEMLAKLSGEDGERVALLKAQAELKAKQHVLDHKLHEKGGAKKKPGCLLECCAPRKHHI